MSERKRWFRFRLRTLLLFTLVVACGFGWFGGKLEQSRRQRAVLEALAQSSSSLGVGYDWDDVGSGGILSHDSVGWKVSDSWRQDEPQWLTDLLGRGFFHAINYIFIEGGQDDSVAVATELPELSELEVSNSAPITEADMTRLCRLTGLHNLWIENTRVSNHGLDALARHDGLKALVLLKTPISDEGWRFVADLPNLEQLLTDQASDATLFALANHKSLSGLFLADSNVTSAGLVHIEHMTGLQALVLSHTAISDGGECLRHLGGLNKLKQLGLEGVPLNGEALAYVARLRNLEQLDLSNCGLSDAGLHDLEGMKRLSYLSVSDNDVSNEAVDRLKKKLPNCDIYPKN